MTVAYFDAFSGLSGDMTVGALLDLGVPLAVVDAGLAPLGVRGYRLRHDHLVRSGIHAAKFRVLLEGDAAGAPAPVDPHDHGPAHAGNPAHFPPHAHEHGHRHDHRHEPLHDHVRAGTTGTAHEHSHRHYREIRALLDAAALAPGVRDRAQRVFRALAFAEAKVHATSAEDIAFHEVGAIDAIVDIVGTAICLEYLGIDRIHVSPLPLGRGFARSAHGVIPVPPPATAELLRGFPVLPWDGDRELVTPTGAAIVAALAKPGDPGPFVPIAVGYGAGDRELDDRPNLLRIVLGELAPARGARDASVAVRAARTAVASPASHGEHAAGAAAGPALRTDEMIVLEANIDDMNPQFYEAAVEALFAAGARDVTLNPIVMKKGRPGTQLSVIAEPALREALAATILRETSTIGVRIHPVTRLTLERTSRCVATPWGEVAVKEVVLPDGTTRAMPEYDDCRRIAREHGLAVGRVHETVLVAASRRED